MAKALKPIQISMFYVEKIDEKATSSWKVSEYYLIPGRETAISFTDTYPIWVKEVRFIAPDYPGMIEEAHRAGRMEMARELHELSGESIRRYLDSTLSKEDS